MQQSVFAAELRSGGYTLKADIARREAARSTESASSLESDQSAEMAQGNVQWDQKQAIQNDRFGYAISETHICARDAATVALRTGVRNREQIGSAVVSICKAQLALLFMGAKAAGMSSQRQTSFANSLIDTEIDSVLRLGR